MSTRAYSEPGFSLERLTFLVDGIYAISLTLLALELKLPEDVMADGLLSAILENGPRFLAFGIAFNAAAIGWAWTHFAYGLMARSNYLHLICTLASLAVVALIPFSASLLGRFPASPWSVVAYSVNIALLTGIYTADLVLNQSVLVPETVDRRLLRALWQSTLACLVFCLVSIPFAFINARATLLVGAGVTLLIWVKNAFMAGWIARETRAVHDWIHSSDPHAK
jgi:uncharacterized membrane protein